jgi:hypothetical protein
MCKGCYYDSGAPTMIPDNAAEIVDAIRALYAHPRGAVGGPLHVELDDWNIEDGFWEPWSGEGHLSDPYGPGIMTLAQTVADHMLPLSEGQRAAVMALWMGWLTPEGKHTA